MEYTVIRQNFEKHGFSTQLFPAKEEARDYLVDILKNQTIGFGGGCLPVQKCGCATKRPENKCKDAMRPKCRQVL